MCLERGASQSYDIRLQQEIHSLAPVPEQHARPRSLLNTGRCHGLKGDTGLYEELIFQMLGYPQYAACGGNWASYIVEALGFHYAEHCVATHSTISIVQQHGASVGSSGSPAEATAYARLRLTEPVKLKYATADSRESHCMDHEARRAWSDLTHHSRFEDVSPLDTLLDEVMMCLVTDSFHSSRSI